MTAMEFEIRVSGALPQDVLTELGGVRVVTQSLETVLQGPVRDQAALIGIINRLQGLGVELRGVRQLGTIAESPGILMEPDRARCDVQRDAGNEPDCAYCAGFSPFDRYAKRSTAVRGQVSKSST